MQGTKTRMAEIALESAMRKPYGICLDARLPLRIKVNMKLPLRQQRNRYTLSI